MCSVYGLPRFVATLLRHMEAHQDCLKWNLIEGTHKITLTLTWSFPQQHQQPGGKEGLFGRIQRSLKLAAPDTPSHRTPNSPRAAVKSPTLSKKHNLPEDLTQFLDCSTTKKRTVTGSVRRQLSLTSPYQRSPGSWKRMSTRSLPSPTRYGSMPRSRSHPGDNTACQDAANAQEKQHSSDCVGPGRSADDLLSSPSLHGATGGYPRHSTPNHTLDLSLVGAASFASSPERSRVQISYREEEDVAQSVEELNNEARVKNAAQLETIKKEWSEVMKNWDLLVLRDNVGSVQEDAVLHQPVESQLDLSSDASDADLLRLQATVTRCIHSCDNILQKNSTDIT